MDEFAKREGSMANLDALAMMRDVMVDSQVRPNEVKDLRVSEAMRMLPREAFAPLGSLAYSDQDLSLGNGRYMLQAMTIARLAQLALEKNPHHVLVVGAGSGYLAALLSLAGAEVVALEEDSRLANDALKTCAPKVQAVFGPLAAGWPAGGMYDVIVIEGAVLQIPEILKGQLAPNGRIVTVIADDATPSAVGRAVIAEPVEGGYSYLKVFDCAPRILPQFNKAFSFSY